jgi:hypothetical protein
MHNDRKAEHEINSRTFKALLNDPMVRIVMHADGVTNEDLSAALQIAYKALRRSV